MGNDTLLIDSHIFENVNMPTAGKNLSKIKICYFVIDVIFFFVALLLSLVINLEDCISETTDSVFYTYIYYIFLEFANPNETVMSFRMHFPCVID